MSFDNKCDVLILGGGVIGVSTAYYLSGKGLDVTLIDRNDICAGSSFGNAGWVAIRHAVPIASPGALTQGMRWLLDPGSPFYIKLRADRDLLRWLWQFQKASRQARVEKAVPILLDMHRASQQLFADLALHPDLDFGYTQDGLLLLFLHEKTMAKAIKEATLLAQYNCKSEIISTAALAELEPNIQEKVIGGIYYPQPAHLQPAAFVRQLGNLAHNNGVSVHTQTACLGFEMRNGRIQSVHTNRGIIHAGQVVLAAGAWSLPLAQQAGVRLALQPAKGYSLTVKTAETKPRLPLELEDHKIAVTPMEAGFRFSSTLELAGFDASINQRRLSAMRGGIRQYVSGLDINNAGPPWIGFRPASADGLPIIGRAPGLDNLILATGHGTLGITQGPITGKLVAEIIRGEPPSLDIGPFRSDRFT